MKSRGNDKRSRHGVGCPFWVLEIGISSGIVMDFVVVVVLLWLVVVVELLFVPAMQGLPA